MQFIKILLWVLFVVAGFIFWWTNESRTSLDLGMAIVEARTSTFALGALLLGFLPTWLLLRGSRWRLMRRIRTLEAAALPAPAPLDVAKEGISKPTPTAAPAKSETTEPESIIPPMKDDKAK